jgi:hypothetical protein
MASKVPLDSRAKTARTASMAKQVPLDSLAKTARTASMAKQVPPDFLARTARMASMAKQVPLAQPAKTARMASMAKLVLLDRREIGDHPDPICAREPATSQHCFSYPRARGSTMQYFDASGTLLNCLLPDYGARRGSMRSSVKCLLGFDLRITRVYAQRIPISSRYL